MVHRCMPSLPNSSNIAPVFPPWHPFLHCGTYTTGLKIKFIKYDYAQNLLYPISTSASGVPAASGCAHIGRTHDSAFLLKKWHIPATKCLLKQVESRKKFFRLFLSVKMRISSLSSSHGSPPTISLPSDERADILRHHALSKGIARCLPYGWRLPIWSMGFCIVQWLRDGEEERRGRRTSFIPLVPSLCFLYVEIYSLHVICIVARVPTIYAMQCFALRCVCRDVVRWL